MPVGASALLLTAVPAMRFVMGRWWLIPPLILTAAAAACWVYVVRQYPEGPGSRRLFRPALPTGPHRTEAPYPGTPDPRVSRTARAPAVALRKTSRYRQNRSLRSVHPGSSSAASVNDEDAARSQRVAQSRDVRNGMWWRPAGQEMTS